MKTSWLFLLFFPILSAGQSHGNDLFAEPKADKLVVGEGFKLITERSGMFIQTKKKNDFKPVEDYLGDTIYYESRTKEGELVFRLPDKNKFLYNSFMNYLDGLISIDKAKKIRDSLNGKTYFVLTDSWYQLGKPHVSLKYFPIKVIDVKAND